MMTAAREIYCQERANGKSQYEASLIAFPSRRKWKRNAVDTQAHILERNSEIVERIKELKQPTQDLLEANRTAVIQKVLDIGLQNIKVETTTITALTTLLNKLVATKTESKVDVKGELTLLELIRAKGRKNG